MRVLSKLREFPAVFSHIRHNDCRISLPTLFGSCLATRTALNGKNKQITQLKVLAGPSDNSAAIKYAVLSSSRRREATTRPK